MATAEAVDTVMKLGMAHPMGPLALADFIGLGVCLAILEVMHTGLSDRSPLPLPAAPQDGGGRRPWAKEREGVLQLRVSGQWSVVSGQ